MSARSTAPWERPEPRLGDRSGFPRLEVGAYLAHAALSPPGRWVEDAVAAHLESAASRGIADVERWLENAELARRRFAALIGARAADVAAVGNTSTAVAAIATAIPWRRGDRVLLFEDEFPANSTPWHAALRPAGVEIVHLPSAPFLGSHEAGLASVRKALEEGPVRLIATSAVQFQTGLAMPTAALGALAQQYGAELFVDAIQAVGSLPMDVASLGCHYLAAGAHKWLMGTLGTAFLWVDPQSARRLVPKLVGWTSHDVSASFLSGPASELRRDRPLRTDARVFEAGVQNHLGLAAAGAGMGVLLQLGIESIRGHIQAYHDRLEPGLLERGFVSLRSPEFPGRSGILALWPPGGIDAAELSRALSERGVASSAPCGNLRLAPHWPNGFEEVPGVLAAVDSALAALRP